MCGSDKHVCMLPEGHGMVHPTATFFQRQVSKFRELNLPCEWHHGTALFIRSLKRLRLERERHLQICWLVWHPYSPIKYYWDCIQLFFMFFAFIYLPFQVFVTCPDYYDKFILFTDAIAFLNFCSRFFTGYVDKEIIVLEPKRILVHYLKTHFFVNLIGSLPLQLIRPFDNCLYPTHTAMFVFKLLRVFSLSDPWKNVVGQFQLSYINYVALKVMLIAIMFFHWMTYIHHQIPNLCYHFYSLDDKYFANWLQEFGIKTHASGNITTGFQKYTKNLYLVCGLCIGALYYAPLDQHFVVDFLMSSSIGLIGLLFVPYIFCALLRLTIYRQYDSYLFRGKYKALEENMAFMRLPFQLRRKIQLFINYRFHEHYFNEAELQNTINEQVKNEINLHCCKGLVMNVPMFQDMPVALINSIVFNLERVLFMPGETIVKHGIPGSSIYLISSGTVAVMTSAGREVAHLRDGAFFGESALLRPGALRTASIVALEITEIYTLGYKEFTQCLQPYPHLKRKMEEITLNKRTALFKQAERHRLLKRHN
ncbi:unnamed protein product [Arctia plantaginis]|uniref:Cyclic nucleotide-binding domain-containing protein n=1 Tax=Arctia plantaginis TaxID=874455 RepID=A0A8S1B3I0_ARCPL|nr:unnamed protein product [Arctia plantaginis]